MRAKTVHRAGMVDQAGNVSARCFKTPRPIDLRRATWTNRDEAVTCKACIAVHEQWERERAEASK